MANDDTALDLRAWMDQYGWSVRKLAVRLDAAPRTVQAYAAGEETMPYVWALSLELLVANGERGDRVRIVDGALVPVEPIPA